MDTEPMKRSSPVMTGVIMPGGYHYAENGKMIVEDAISYDDLIDQLSKYRATNGLPFGDPQQDVDRYICATYPVMCQGRLPEPEEGVDAIELSYGQPVKRTPRERVMSWASNRMQKAGQIELVDTEEAERRAGICANCPKQLQWNAPVDGCPGCQVYVEEAEAMLIKIRRNKSTGVRSIQGHSCDVGGHDLETACWLESSALKHRRNYEGKFPENCWLVELD